MPSGGASTIFLSCLLGSERALEALSHSLGFLSCLLGSELLAALHRPHDKFLSCLLGSERAILTPLLTQRFSKLPTRQ